MGKIKDIFLWVYWYPFRLFIQKIPPVYAYSMAKMFALFLYYVSIKKRAGLEKEFSYFQKKAVGLGTRNVIINALTVLCRNEMDVLLFSELNRETIGSFVGCAGIEYLDNALAKGKGVMLLFAHFGANQMIMPAVGYRGYTMSQMSAPPTVWVKKLPNKKFSRMERRVLELRWAQELSLPVSHLNIFGFLKDVFLCLKRNEILGIAIDGGGGKSTVAVDFLGRKALFPTGAVEIAMKTGCAVLPTFIVRGKDGRQTMIVEPPLSIMTGGDHAVESNTSAFVKRLEEYIYKYPCHYLNFLSLRTFMEEQGNMPFFVKRNNYESITGKTTVS